MIGFAEIRLILIALAIVGGLSGVAAWSHTIKHEATKIAVAECNEDKLRLANESLGEQYKAETEARKIAEARLKEREADARMSSAAYSELKARYDALSKTPQPNDGKPFLDPADPWWMSNGGRSKSRP